MVNSKAPFEQLLTLQVIDYLAKKGYTKTEAMLRAESSNQEVSQPLNIQSHVVAQAPKYLEAFELFRAWTEDTLDVYKPELRRLLWPVFVHSYLSLVVAFYQSPARSFYEKFSSLFKPEHEVELRSLERITLPEHVKDDNIAKVYTNNKYRLVMSDPAFTHLMTFLESNLSKGGRLIIPILTTYMDVRHVDRAVDDRYSFASMMLKNRSIPDMPAEDEGIPGHAPGNSISSTDPQKGLTLAALKLGKLLPDPDVESDVRAEVSDLDDRHPPGPGQNSLLATHEAINIKQEDDVDGPSRTDIPYPISTARDVALEVQKIVENRDRFKIEGRTGGIGPGVSVCMYTFHNTFDSINCIDFSGDYQLVAAGMSESYIRVWSLDGTALDTPESHLPNHQPTSSYRLIGHSGPVYAVSFAPSSRSPPNASPSDPSPSTKWLLSCSADSTIRLWNLSLWQNIVAYRGHIGPVFSVSWGPFGHYFCSTGHDKTARIWSTDKIRNLRILPGHDDSVDCVAWHPNSAYVFTASADRTVRMWAVSTGNSVRMFTGHVAAITALACAPNGRVLASADDGGNILLWDLGPGRLIKRMRGHGKGGVWSLGFSVESTVLTSGGADGTARIWDVQGPARENTGGTLGSKAGETGLGITGKGDGAGGTAGASSGGAAAATGVNLGAVGGGVGGGVKTRKGRDAVVTADQISAFPTKSTPVYKVMFTRMNLVLAGGAFMG